MGVPIFESTLKGWPVGVLGVAVTRQGIVVRSGMTAESLSEAIRVGRLLYASEYGDSYEFAIDSGPSNVKPDELRDVGGDRCA